MPKQNIDKVLQFFSSLSDKTRLKIVISLSKNDKTVTEIYNGINENITLSAISHQLKLLSNLGIVKFEKFGRERYYKLSKNFCWCILHDAFDHFSGKCKCSRRK